MAGKRHSGKQRSLKSKHSRRFNSVLNPKFTFDNFVVSDCNRFAYEAALDAANNPVGLCNPLFIYGADGLGKTHLLRAIANKVLKCSGDALICCCTAETFFNEMIYAIRSKEMSRFRKKLRAHDILLFDDAMFLSGHEASQSEFYHTFNAFRDSGKLIVITSDRLPDEMDFAESGLHSRFAGCLLVEIKEPDLETRRSILKVKSEMHEISLSSEVIDLLAAVGSLNVREIEGLLIRLGAYKQFMKTDITVELAMDILKDVLKGDGSGAH